MKAIRNVLFVHADDNSLGPIFKAILQREISTDPVLATAGLRIDSAGFEATEGESLRQSARSALKTMGIQELDHTSKNVWLHQDLVRWADLILVPSLLEEDLLCLKFNEAWSKTLPVECYCGQYRTETRFHPGTTPRTEEELRAAADVFKRLFPHVINRLKDSYASALIAIGISMNQGAAIGTAYVAKRGKELQDFTEGNVLVIDRAGTLMFKDINEAVATSIINKFIQSPVITSNMQDIMNDFLKSLEGKTPGEQKWLASGLGAFEAVLARAKALICSRGRHSGEIAAKALRIPCISSCVGATERIATGQTVVVDAGRGEVYDASLLQNLH